jgi:hypothetical protein
LVKVPLSLLGNGYVFYAGRVVSKERRRLVLPRTSCEKIEQAYEITLVCGCVCASAYPPIVARQRLGENPVNVAKQLLSKSSLIAARQRLRKNPPIVARQRLGRNVAAVTNTHAKIEELFDALFSMFRASYQGK